MQVFDKHKIRQICQGVIKGLKLGLDFGLALRKGGYNL